MSTQNLPPSGKNRECRPLFTLLISPSCYKRYKSIKKHSRMTLHWKPYTTQHYMSHKSSQDCIQMRIVLLTEWRTPNERETEGTNLIDLMHAERSTESCLLTISPRSLSWTDFMSFLIRHIWKHQAEQQGFSRGNRIQHNQDKHVTTWDKQNVMKATQQKMTRQTAWQSEVTCSIFKNWWTLHSKLPELCIYIAN